ncbi:MAG: hypothetical protein Q4G11_05590 [Gallicola sp.]|nr:hypothetical protein [Gallicola sp.]
MDNELNEMQGMTDEQFKSFIKAIIIIIEKSETNEEAIKHLETLLE